MFYFLNKKTLNQKEYIIDCLSMTAVIVLIVWLCNMIGQAFAFILFVLPLLIILPVIAMIIYARMQDTLGEIVDEKSFKGVLMVISSFGIAISIIFMGLGLIGIIALAFIPSKNQF